MNPLKMLKLKPDGFQFILDVSVDAPPAAVWKTIFDAGKWFRFDRDTPPVYEKMAIEPKIGGRFFSMSKDGKAGAIHGTVMHLEPEKLLRIHGPMGMTHLPVDNVMIWELQPQKGGKATLLRFCQRAYGYLTPGKKKDFMHGWGTLLPQLKAVAEKSGKKK